MEIHFGIDARKDEVFSAVHQFIDAIGLNIVAQDYNRPWGGFFVLDEKDSDKFISLFFPGYTRAELTIGDKLSPKFLIVAPGQRLSWQYHHRRAEIWRVLKNDVKVATSLTDEENEPKIYHEGEVLVLPKGERHRLVGHVEYGIVAEIWQHTDPANPSDEDDIVRLQDDYGR